MAEGTIENKYFGKGGRLNADDAAFSVGQEEWVNMENCRTGTTDKGFTGVVESIGSTEQISQPMPSIVFTEIGSVSDDENNRIIRFLFCNNAPFHKIVCYYKSNNYEYDVLLSSQVDGGLNFNKNTLIHSARIINDMLYWVESDINQPRKININSAIKSNYPSFETNEVPYSFPLLFNEINIIKSPPSFCPNISKATDGLFSNNFINNNSFQFSFQYVYYDNETTVVGSYSPSSRLNAKDETYNYIQIKMDNNEYIPYSVRLVNLIVRISNSNKAFKIKTWDREISSENQELENQNNLSSPLSYNFYNDTTGEYLAEDDVLRPFDNVPIYSETLEIAKNRLFLANNTVGYNTPKETSLTTELVEFSISGATINKNLISFRWTRYRIPSSVGGLYSGKYYGGWYVYLTEILPNGYYLVNGTETESTYSALSPILPTLSTPPTTVALSGLTFKASTITELLDVTDFYSSYPSFPSGYYVNTTTSNIVSITGITQTIYNTFAQNSPYKIGIVFYDFAMRKCGVLTNNNLTVNTPIRDYNYSSIITGVNWELSNTNSLNEIPDWAYYYSIVRTLNLRTRFFVDSISTLKYATKDSDGNYVFSNLIWSNNVVGIAINSTELIKSGLGYTYSEGDVCILIKNDNTTYELPIIGQDGSYIILKPQDLGTLNTDLWVFELYTPYKTSEQEPFFEVGEINKILNPTTQDRQYDITNGTLLPDSYALTRNFESSTYFACAMSPNDLFYKTWYNDSGKLNLITKLGQVNKTQYISWSDTFFPNTTVNGLSTFRALNEKSVDENCGHIQKLQLTSKIQNEGTVMISICTNETNSMYLGETQIIDSTGGTQFFSASQNVISTINILRGSFGTVNPESVVFYRGSVFWLDAINGRYIQYSQNGLYPISNQKMTKFWKLFSQQYLSMTKEQIEALGSRPFVFSTVDSSHDELLITIPKLFSQPVYGYLPDYPSTIYPFDIWDGQAKTIVYKLGIDGTEVTPHWQGSYSFTPEGYSVLNNELYSSKNGLLHKHNSLNSQNNFYGTQYYSKVMFVSNKGGEIPKVYNNINIQSNIIPNFVYLYNNYPIQQSSDLLDIDFRLIEGIYYGRILRNKLVPTATGFTTDGLLTGEKMRNQAMYIMCQFAPTTQPLNLRFINVDFQISLGHKL